MRRQEDSYVVLCGPSPYRFDDPLDGKWVQRVLHFVDGNDAAIGARHDSSEMKQRNKPTVGCVGCLERLGGMDRSQGTRDPLSIGCKLQVPEQIRETTTESLDHELDPSARVGTFPVPVLQYGEGIRTVMREPS